VDKAPESSRETGSEDNGLQNYNIVP
jgi:hypothetical protein